MKSYTITVNGNVYDVTVEENGAVSAPAAAPRRAAAPARQHLQGRAPAGCRRRQRKDRGRRSRKRYSRSSLLSVHAVKKGDTIIVLEIMKMETPVVATQDGTVASINVSVGDMVEAGPLLATLNN